MSNLRKELPMDCKIPKIATGHKLRHEKIATTMLVDDCCIFLIYFQDSRHL